MRNNKGFTLVEMLIVIAIIGILSATVLTALGPSRNKAKDARIISNLQQVRAVAETLYDGDYNALPNGVVQPSESNFGSAAADIAENQGALTINVSADGLEYAAYSDLATGNGSKWYCVDSAGVARELVANPGVATSCPTPAP